MGSYMRGGLVVFFVVWANGFLMNGLTKAAQQSSPAREAIAVIHSATGSS